MADKQLRRALRKLDLKAYYDAINARWFDGRLPQDVVVAWRTQKQLEKKKGMHHVYGFAGFTKGWKQCIVLNIDAHVKEPKQLLNTMVHEAIHILMPFGDELKRTPQWFKYDKTLTTTLTAHGEGFGAEARRINNVVGFKLMSDKDCSHGIDGRKWAYDNVVEKCYGYDYVDECGIDMATKCDFKGTKREVRKHKKEHEALYEKWNEKYGDKWDGEKMEYIGALADAYDDFKDDLLVKHDYKIKDEEIIRLWKEQL